MTTLPGERSAHPEPPTHPFPRRSEPQSPADAADHPPQAILPAADGCAIALEVMPMLRRWVDGHQVRCNGELVPLTCLSTTFFAPRLPAARHYLVARVSLWIFMVDDAVADPQSRTDDVRRLLDRCLAVVDGAAADSDEPLVRALQDIRHDVDALAPDPAVRAQWQVCMRELLDGLRLERELAPATATAAAAPSPEEYLLRARPSIGTEVRVMTLWIAIQDPRLPELLPQLLEPLHDAAAAVSLADDLRRRGRAKARGAGDAPAGVMPEIEARTMISKLLDRCRENLEPLFEDSYGPAVALERFTLWPIRLYERMDAGRTF